MFLLCARKSETRVTGIASEGGILKDEVKDGGEGRSRRAFGPLQRLVFPMNDVGATGGF